MRGPKQRAAIAARPANVRRAQRELQDELALRVILSLYYPATNEDEAGLMKTIVEVLEGCSTNGSLKGEYFRGIKKRSELGREAVRLMGFRWFKGKPPT